MSKILIIEDEEPIRRVLVRILNEEDSNFKIHEAWASFAKIERVPSLPPPE